MPNNKALLTTLEQTLTKVYPSVVQKLNGGMTTGEIDKYASLAQLTFTDEIYDLFTWKNGIRQTAGGSPAQLLIFPNGIPYSLNEAVDDYDLQAVTKHLFQPNYFPLFSSGTDDILLIDLDADSDTYKMISLYSPPLLDGGDPMTIYDSFSSMLETVIACYDQKAFWVAEDRLAVDGSAYHAIASNFNRNSEFWQFM